MKVLWLANTPCKAADLLCPEQLVGGWLYALDEALGMVPDLELHVAFRWPVAMAPFQYKSTWYHPIHYPRASAMTRLLRRAGKALPDEGGQAGRLEVVRHVAPQLIHVHGTEEDHGLVLGEVDIPSVLSIQGLLGPYCEKFFSGIPRDVADGKTGWVNKIGFNSPSRRLAQMERRAQRERRIMSRLSNVIGRTDWDRRVARILAPRARYHQGEEILRQGFRETSWEPRISGGRFRIVTTMSDGLYKGLEAIAKAASALKWVEGFQFEWLVLGQEGGSESARLVSKWLGIDWGDLGIRLVGRQTEREIVRTFMESDMYCQVSHIENSSNSLCEAMLVGLPIVATSVGGTSSMLTDGKDGILVQDGDAHVLAGAILELADHPERAAEFGRSARGRALVRHDPLRVATETVATYRRILVERDPK